MERSTEGQSRFEEALSIKERHIPKRICKYRNDCTNSRTSLETDTLWLSPPDSFNDPYDCSFRFCKADVLKCLSNIAVDRLRDTKRLEGYLSAEQIGNAKGSPSPLNSIADDIPGSSSIQAAKLKNTVEQMRTLVNRQLEDTVSLFQKFRKGVKVCSFSARNDSLLMWGHYADHHRGFCLEYDLEHLGADHQLREALYPVIYSNEGYDLTPWLLKSIKSDPIGCDSEHLTLSVIYKSVEWEYEGEWRFVDTTSTAEEGRSWQVPTPTAVFLGSKMEAAKVDELQAICAGKGIQVWQMHLADDRFELLPEHLSG